MNFRNKLDRNIFKTRENVILKWSNLFSKYSRKYVRGATANDPLVQARSICK
jgi:hypothetical protein